MLDAKGQMAPQELLIVAAAAKAGMFDILRTRAVTLEELTERHGFDRRAVWTVLEALIALGYVERRNDGFILTPLAEEAFFQEDSENFIGNGVIHTLQVIKSWTHLPEILKTGQPPQRQRDAQDTKGFMAAMRKNARQIADTLADLCLADLPASAAVLDLGGGPLNYARPFARRGARVTVQDIPEVCAIMSPLLLPEETISFTAGDFTEWVCPGEFDLVFLGNICHIYGPAENQILLSRVRQVLKPGGRVAIMDFVRGASPRAELFAVNMLANTVAGGTWTLEEYSFWLEQSGFTHIVMHTIADRQVITAQCQ